MSPILNENLSHRHLLRRRRLLFLTTSGLAVGTVSAVSEDLGIYQLSYYPAGYYVDT